MAAVECHEGVDAGMQVKVIVLLPRQRINIDRSNLLITNGGNILLCSCYGSSKATFAVFIAYCMHTDWRIPTRNMLSSISMQTPKPERHVPAFLPSCFLGPPLGAPMLRPYSPDRFNLLQGPCLRFLCSGSGLTPASESPSSHLRGMPCCVSAPFLHGEDLVKPQSRLHGSTAEATHVIAKLISP